MRSLIIPLSTAAAISLGLAGCKTLSSRADDDAISVEEFESGLVGHIVEYADMDGDGKMTYAEWSAVYKNATREKFAAADLDGDGKLDVEEAEESAKATPLWTKLMEKVDLDSDGTISAEERDAFVDVMAKADDDDQVNMLRRIAEE